MSEGGGQMQITRYMAYKMQAVRYRQEAARWFDADQPDDCEVGLRLYEFANEMDKLAHSLTMDKASEVFASSGWRSVKF